MRSSDIRLRKLKLRLRDKRFANHKVPCTAIWQQPLQSVLALRSCSATDLFFCRVIVDVSISYSAVYSPARNDGPMFRYQWWFCLRRCLVRYHSDPNVFVICHACLFMHLCELFWDPSCTDVLKPKFVVHHFVGLTMANLQNMCHFINSHSSVKQNHVTCTLNVVIRDGFRRSSGSFVMRNIFAVIFLNFSIHS